MADTNCSEGYTAVHEDYYSTAGVLLGYTIECVRNDIERCESWILVPGENLWNDGVRGFLYLLAMVWTFVGIAIASDIFMMSIEAITAKKRKISHWDNEKQEVVEREVLIWNETVANLTLMALGSSAPEILIAFMEALSKLPPDEETAIKYQSEGNLGVFTIMGSASYNLLMISAICIVSPELPAIKKVSQFTVFLLTSGWSIFAYVWMLLVVKVISPDIVEIWEAMVTLSFFPLLAITAYCQDNHWWVYKCRGKVASSEDDDGTSNSHPGGPPHHNIRVVTNDHHGHLLHGRAKELVLIENEHQQKVIRKSHQNLHDVEEGSQEFRHAAVKSLTGAKQRPKTPSVRDVRLPDMDSKSRQANFLSEEDMCGKFTFAAPSYSVMESAGTLEVDIIFHRKRPSKSKMKIANGTSNNNNISPISNGTVETALVEDNAITGVVAVQWETREGSAKLNRDFQFSSGKLVFNSDEVKKTVTIPIVNDNEFEPDTDFYIILKNPEGDAGLGDPSVARVTIIDDDEPGELSFAKNQNYAENGKVVVTVVRSKGCDGGVSVNYRTFDGSAKGGSSLDDADYIATEETLEFKHAESSKVIAIECTDPKKPKNFIITLSNPTLGAKIGPIPAAFVNLAMTDDGLGERLGELVSDEVEEPETWPGQFVSALTLSPEEDDDGAEVELTWFDYLMHFISLPWKLFCALIPPKRYCGGMLSFVFSILWLGIMSLIVEQLASLLGCVIGLRTAASGVSIVALGTSVPDTFASRTAAKQDEHADAAIGNITGSNSVNVFLGLGLPWVLLSIYYRAYLKMEYKVQSDNLTQAVILFVIVGGICLCTLLIRRFTVGGELGGRKTVAYATAAFLVTLWVSFILIVILIVYGIIGWHLP